MLTSNGELSKLGRTDELLAVVGKYGDNAMNFIWKNKGALLAGTAMAAFLANPEPFIDGSKELAQSAIAPIAKEIGSNTNWTVTIIGLVICLMTYSGIKFWIRSKARK
jgi:hypothetical protein